MSELLHKLDDALALMSLRSLRVEMYDTLSACLKGGSAVQDTFGDLAEFAKEEGQSSKMRVYESLANDVRNSPDLALGLAAIADQNDRMVLAISSTAKDTAALVASVSQMAKLRKAVTNAAFNIALFYGLFLLLMASLAYAFSGQELVPQLLRSIPLDKHPSISVIQAAVGAGFQAWWPVAALFVLVLVVFVIWSLPRLTGSLRDVLDRLPIYASYKAMTSGNFLVTLAILYKNEIDTTTALDMIRDNATPYLAYQVKKMFLRQQDESSSDQLGMFNTGFIDSDLLAMIRVVAKNLSPVQAVTQIALGQTDKLLQKVSQASSVASGVLLLLGGVILILTVMGSIGLLPVLMENLGSSGQR